MVLGPFIIALVIGLLVSAGLYFVLVWPRKEPPDGEDADHRAQADQSADKAR